jgi:hypothetical protein
MTGQSGSANNIEVRKKILDALKIGSRTCEELVKTLSIPRSTMRDNLERLVQDGVVGRNPIRDHVKSIIRCRNCSLWNFETGVRGCKIKNVENCRDTFKKRVNKRRGRPRIEYHLEGS